MLSYTFINSHSQVSDPGPYGPLFFSFCFSHQRISQGAVQTTLVKQLDSVGPNCFSSGIHTSISMETYSHLGFSRVITDPLLPPHSGSAHVFLNGIPLMNMLFENVQSE